MIAWHDRAFSELSIAELYDILALRQHVFIVEQRCPYLDADGLDPKCRHVWAVRDKDLVAYLRVVPPGLKYVEPSLGRIVTSPGARGTGLGRVLVRRGIALVAVYHGPVAIRIGAQAYLEKFYGTLGFKRAGANYDEDGIPHLEMVRPASA
jgi:ElaA protein